VQIKRHAAQGFDAGECLGDVLGAEEHEVRILPRMGMNQWGGDGFVVDAVSTQKERGADAGCDGRRTSWRLRTA
jgi:hypothetical protein